ncbi:hypothetical protein ACIG5E_17335 [Kitasatospora sp. NPDC053057]|uniref:hypothetical protein n=1 Tax=Kitasatospora sp. NPDC053057 TaxID=3364062 RepID=UPI0037C62323
MGEVTVRPVSRVVGGREEMRDDGWGSVGAVIRPAGGQFTEEALYGRTATERAER